MSVVFLGPSDRLTDPGVTERDESGGLSAAPRAEHWAVRCACDALLILPEELRHGMCLDCRLYCEACGDLVGVYHADGSATVCDGCEDVSADASRSTT